MAIYFTEALDMAYRNAYKYEISDVRTGLAE